ncbi:MAG: NAD(P)/FAD-dependent oxidoreductase [Chloroflexi bacterium]|nr:NAD(P)/FAD-dependent oxidoreductase [Chloroflexota bacterium]
MVATGELDADVVVIGAGVVGLAVAARLARERSAVVIERREGPALETSAHNSQVVHAGIYYPTGSRKHLLCVAGNRALYAWCSERGVPAARTGKLVAALTEEELPALEGVWEQAAANGVPGMGRLSAEGARALEPAVPCRAALHSESSGVVDAGAFARSLEGEARSRGALLAYRHELRGAARVAGGFVLEAADPDGEAHELRCAALVNAAGHGAPLVARAAGYPLDGGAGVPAFRQRVNKGRYYDVVDASLARRVSRHVYPVPAGGGGMDGYLARAGGLGVHLTVDLDGGLHLGPDTEWLEEGAALDYRALDDRREAFLAAGRRLLPELGAEGIAPGQVGYRPKLHGPGEPAADFLIWGDRGYVHLGGIESPGLTASLAIAEEVASLLA